MNFRDRLKNIGKEFGISLTPENVDEVQRHVIDKLKRYGI